MLLLVLFALLSLYIPPYLVALAAEDGWSGFLFGLAVVGLPLVGGLVFGGPWSRMPGNDLILVAVGYVLWVSAAISMIGMFIWGPFGFAMYGAGLSKATRLRGLVLLDWTRLIWKKFNAASPTPQ